MRFATNFYPICSSFVVRMRTCTYVPKGQWEALHSDAVCTVLRADASLQAPRHNPPSCPVPPVTRSRKFKNYGSHKALGHCYEQNQPGCVFQTPNIASTQTVAILRARACSI